MKGHIQFTVEQARNWIYISIKDDGPGIPHQHQKYIFEKFYRIHDNNRHEVNGSGLGLYYVKQVVSAHGGKVKVRSEAQYGTEIIMTIPLR